VPVSEVVELLGVKAAEKKLLLSAVWSNDCPEEVYFDPMRVTQILTNLVGNAIKFTEKGEIVLHCQCELVAPDQAVLSYAVRDTGQGMTPEQLSRICRPYVQASDDTARTHGGTGLGLALSRQLALAMQGSIDIISHLGQGSIFTLKIKCKVDPQAKWSRPPGESNDGISRIIADNRSAEYERPKTSTPAAPPPPPAPSPDAPQVTRPALRTMAVIPGDILVVDDEELNRMLASRILGGQGHVVDTAPDGLEAVEKALAAFAGGRPYKVIFLDMHMPVMDGVEAARRIRAAGIPSKLIALTGDASDDQVQQAKSAGCSGQAQKPYDWNELIRFAQS
jgi:CheY-like chemotaxis protein